MISFDQAYETVLAAAVPLGSERVDLEVSLGRVLAEDVHGDRDLPPFRKSAMDGYACRRADLGAPLAVVETIPAGQWPTRDVGPGECAKIMTGAPVPEGADCVVMVEETAVDAAGRVRFTGHGTNANICAQGEDLEAGQLVLARGTRVGPAEIAVLATVGAARPLVSRQPRVAVLATGSELVDAAAPATGARIRNSNGYQLAAQLTAMGCLARHHGVVEDTRAALVAAIASARREEADLLLFSGGVSMGDFDFVPAVLREAGFVFAFESVAMQPGRPTVFGTDGRTFCCGLPGNPVSTFVVFELLLKPFLFRLMGHAFQPRLVAATLGEAIARRGTGRQSTLPVAFTAPGVVTPLAYHGSGHINAMTQAEGLVTIPAGVERLEKGTVVHVRPL